MDKIITLPLLTQYDGLIKEYIASSISGLVDSAPETLDTLNELAAALGDDPNFATTISSQIGEKLSTSTYNADKATFALKSQLSSYLTTSAASSTYLTKEAASSTYQPKGNYLTSVSWSQVSGKPEFATVATSGSYDDLTDKPTIPSLAGYATQSWVQGLGYMTKTTADGLYQAKGSYLTSVNLATISDLHANWDALLKATPSVHVTRWPSASEVDGLATVATSGSYNDLKNKPAAYSLPTASSSTKGGILLGYGENGKNYPVELDGESRAYVNVPWTDSNTAYTAGTGLSLSGNTFSVKLGYTTSNKNYKVSADSSGNLYVNVPWTDNNTTYNVATQSTNGLMSSSDKTKLDGMTAASSSDITALFD